MSISNLYLYKNTLLPHKQLRAFEQNRSNKRRGFTLIEILLVVGFIAIAGTVIYTVFNKIQTTNLVNQEIERVRKIQSGLSTLFASTPTIPDVSPRIMYQARIIDREDLGDPDPSNTGNNTLKST